MVPNPGSRALPNLDRGVPHLTRTVVLLLLGLASACRSSPDAPRPLSQQPELDAFAHQVAAHLKRHAWRDVIVAASPAHYRVQVAEHGMPEPQYVAELFGLHRTDNSIKRGERVEWADLERIADVELERIEAAGSDHALVGAVTLQDGTRLELHARLAQEAGQYVLTGAVG